MSTVSAIIFAVRRSASPVGPQSYASASRVSLPTSLIRIKPRKNLIVSIRFGLAT